MSIFSILSGGQGTPSATFKRMGAAEVAHLKPAQKLRLAFFWLGQVNILTAEYARSAPTAVLVYQQLSDIKRKCIFIEAVSRVSQFSCLPNT